LELVLLLPFVVTVFLLLVGLGHTLSAKQHALVAARYATTFEVARGQAPQADDVADAASRGAGQWQLDLSTEDAPPFDVGVELLEPFTDAVSQVAAGSGRVGYVASTTPQRGIVPRLHPSLPAASARYNLPGSTWTCTDLGGSSYLTFILNQGPVGDVLDTDGEECCQNYQGS
jgi:hypothetical protein